MKQLKVLALVIGMAGVAGTALAETTKQPLAPQPMTNEQVKTLIDQQRETYEKQAEQHKAYAEAQRAHFESIMKAQQAAQEKHMQAMIDHMENLRKHFDSMAEKTRAALDAQQEAQQRQVYGYMLGMMPEGEMKEAFKASEAKRIQMMQDMKVKHQEMKQQMEAARQEARAKFNKAVKSEA